MEIRLRTLLLLAVTALILAAGAIYFYRQKEKPAATSVSSTHEKSREKSAVVINFMDESEKWDWDAACTVEVISWLARHPELQIFSLSFILVDEEAREDLRHGADKRKLAIGVAYPDWEKPEGQAFAGCTGNGNIRCYIGRLRGEGEALDVATISAALYALSRHLKTPAPEEAANFKWDWNNYYPLLELEKEGGEWKSKCLRIYSQKH